MQTSEQGQNAWHSAPAATARVWPSRSRRTTNRPTRVLSDNDSRITPTFPGAAVAPGRGQGGRPSFGGTGIWSRWSGRWWDYNIPPTSAALPRPERHRTRGSRTAAPQRAASVPRRPNPVQQRSSDGGLPVAAVLKFFGERASLGGAACGCLPKSTSANCWTGSETTNPCNLAVSI
jgi:hypothetical protein